MSKACKPSRAIQGGFDCPKRALVVPLGDILAIKGYVAGQWIERNAAFGVPDYLERNITGSVGSAFEDIAGPKAIVTLSRSF